MPETLPGSSLMSASREQMVNLVSPWSRSLGSQAGDRDCRRRACETGGIQQRSALSERDGEPSVEHITGTVRSSYPRWARLARPGWAEFVRIVDQALVAIAGAAMMKPCRA